MNESVNGLQMGFGAALATFIAFLPKVLVFLAILIVGYFVAKWLGKLVDALLEKINFDHLVERGGIKRALKRTGYDPSDIVGKFVFYVLVLFVAQLAFGIFGPNPVSELLTRTIVFLPNVFVALIMVIVSAVIARAVRELIYASIGGLQSGRFAATGAFVAILAVGIFAALTQLKVAPAIVIGLFYAILATFVGCAVVAIGGGGISVMRVQWEKAMRRIEEEAPKVQQHIRGGPQAEEDVREWAQVEPENPVTESITEPTVPEAEDRS